MIMNEYWVRTKVSDENGVETYYAAQRLAHVLATAMPGLTFEVSQDKVWMTTTAPEE